MKKNTLKLSLALSACLITAAHAQINKTPDHPVITHEGQGYTPLSIVSRNMGTATEQELQFPPHHVIGNIYYVGTQTLSSFLIVTPKGNILLNDTYERNVPVIEKSVADLGFKFTDIKIVLGNHAHGDHMEGDALVKQLTGAQVEAMAEDVPALKAMKPGGKEHPVDVIFHDGDKITLGNTTLTAHLTAGHTHGCTTFTTTEVEAGKSYNVVFGCSLRAPAVISPEVEAEFVKTFAVMHALPCDVLLGDHPSQYGMLAKYAAMKPGGPNPFIDKATCSKERDIEEAMYHAILKEQAAAPKP